MTCLECICFRIQILAMILTSKVGLRKLRLTCSEDANDWTVDNPTDDYCCLQHTREVPGNIVDQGIALWSSKFTKRCTSVFHCLQTWWQRWRQRWERQRIGQRFWSGRPVIYMEWGVSFLSWMLQETCLLSDILSLILAGMKSRNAIAARAFRPVLIVLWGVTRV